MGGGVSIALATYNGEAYLQDQLSSFVAQTRRPDELVVSDDGSSDGTLSILKDFARAAPFKVRLLPRGRRLGYADNFMRAASACRGEFIAFSDQDDVWFPAKLEAGAAPLAQGAVLSLHTSILTDKALRPTGLHRQGIHKTRTCPPLTLDPYLTGWGNTLMFRAALLGLIASDKRPPQPERRHRPLSHDQWIFTLAAAFGPVAQLNVPLLYYRQHDHNVFGQRKMGPLVKARISASDPIGRYTDRQAFYCEVGALFAALGDADEGAVWARRAAEVYEDRRAYMAARIALYEDRSISNQARLAPLILTAARAAGVPRRQALAALLKDLLLGGLGASGTSRASADHAAPMLN